MQKRVDVLLNKNSINIIKKYMFCYSKLDVFFVCTMNINVWYKFIVYK